MNGCMHDCTSHLTPPTCSCADFRTPRSTWQPGSWQYGALNSPCCPSNELSGSPAFRLSLSSPHASLLPHADSIFKYNFKVQYRYFRLEVSPSVKRVKRHSRLNNRQDVPVPLLSRFNGVRVRGTSERRTITAGTIELRYYL
jgi:hypothetical protein